MMFTKRLHLLAMACLWLPTVVAGQIVPVYEFCGVGRSVPVLVTIPATTDNSPKPVSEIALFAPDKAEPLVAAPVLAGRVDLAALLPLLWETKPRTVLMAQLRVAGEPIGAPLVLAPMLNQPRAKAKSVPNVPRPVISFEPLEGEQDVYSGVRVWVDQRIVMETDVGEIEITTRPDAAPQTARHFIKLAQGGIYRQTPFHRVVPLTADGKPFVIQGGDPTGTGSGGPGLYVDLENARLPHELGVISMARAADPDSAGSQFFICLSRDGTARLDGSYAAFGVVTSGLETVLKIAATPLAAGTDKPDKPPILRDVRIVDAPPLVPGVPAQVQRLPSLQPNPPR